jgi:hypothetical protein
MIGRIPCVRRTERRPDNRCDRKRRVVPINNWGLPRSTGSIEADRPAALLAQRTARIDAQRAAVALRLTDIRAREAARTTAH